MNNLAKAIQKLKPNSEFVIYNEDYLSIEWHKLEGKAPTKSEIDNALKEIEIEIDNEAELVKTAKASAESKLTALGLTAEEIAALRG